MPCFPLGPGLPCTPCKAARLLSFCCQDKWHTDRKHTHTHDCFSLNILSLPNKWRYYRPAAEGNMCLHHPQCFCVVHIQTLTGAPAGPGDPWDPTFPGSP